MWLHILWPIPYINVYFGYENWIRNCKTIEKNHPKPKKNPIKTEKLPAKEHQNQETESFLAQNWKTDLKNSWNYKTENPNAPFH